MNFSHRFASGVTHRARNTVLVSFVLLAQGVALSGQSAFQASLAMPDRFRENIVRVSAENANPDPLDWLFVCRAKHSAEGILSVRVKNGRVVEQRESPELRVEIANDAPIELSSVVVGSRGAWEIARRYVGQTKDAELGRAKLQLDQSEGGGPAVWSVWCFDSVGGYLGLLKLLASTGDVVFWE